MKCAMLCPAAINTLIANGFVDRTHYRYTFRGYSESGDIIAERYSLWLVLFGGTPEIECVRVIPR